MSSRPTLASLESEAHIWLTEPTAPSDRATCLPLLSPEELAQFERFKVERPRDLYLAARALARSTLSLYAPEVAPTDWRFRFNDHGRPEIEGPPAAPPLRFNLSHTDRLVACLVTLELDAGVDVENIERRLNLVGVARHSFSALEAREVQRRRGTERRERFFRYWTLKEAYIKARGMGLALPLRRFSYTFPAPGEVALELDPELEDRADAWQLVLYRASREHYLAAAIRRAGGEDRPIVVRSSTPLATGAKIREPELLAVSAPAARPLPAER